jgi:hypothetical protein
VHRDPGKTALVKEISELLWRARDSTPWWTWASCVVAFCRMTAAMAFTWSLHRRTWAMVWPSVRRRGARRLIVARIIQSVEDLARFGGA